MMSRTSPEESARLLGSLEATPVDSQELERVGAQQSLL